MLRNIYDELLRLTKIEDAFYSSVQEIEGYNIESFSYRMAGYDMFKHDFGKEMRGIAFIYGNEIDKPKLFTLAYHKFFNYGEGETISEIKDLQIESIQDKVDGSLIMFGKLPNGKIIAKSKTSINSEVANSANNILNSDQVLYSFVEKYLDLGIYPIFEYVGPDNRIVVSYDKSELVFLGMRKISGEYIDTNHLENIRNTEIPHISMSKIIGINNLDALMEKQKNDEGYEGFIVNFKGGYKLKMKLMTYVLKHTAKDNISNQKNLIEICLKEETDDLRTLFSDDEVALEIINSTEKKVYDFYNKVVHEVELLFDKYVYIFEKYKNTSNIEEKKAIRKDLVMHTLKNEYFRLIMLKLDEKDIDFKEYVKERLFEEVKELNS
ncbi:MAG: RNA ligase [Candidatus Gracilibacteria bacterium]|nr:RNA ligase [Candidatus Gracilibacteria bacterium]